ncbi:hypothetical protein GS429_03300 [Natronorubrum sp. JWXQ-INN-674]|uniref:Uncharacterized protein n=1 Tax=Natronorubrum halalkaliphilum TaxID=2691917 RepID=A0A6B0VHT3_9EURY|nr:hypothetical protein [Natronorubrum halalkaliphilum]MXV61100.1 hypothetical protein [Natronorubrum halalkaliphilum]
MERTNATVDADVTDEAERQATAERGARGRSPAATETPTATVAATRTNREDAGDGLPNTLTIIGHGSPSSFELTVDGEIELLEENCTEDTTTVSGSAVEGTVETGTVRFRFAGDLTDVTFVDREITGLSPATAPNVHVDYAAPERSRS